MSQDVEVLLPVLGLPPPVMVCSVIAPAKKGLAFCYQPRMYAKKPWKIGLSLPISRFFKYGDQIGDS